ncbi:XrtA system polysaccharide chain length determinant [Salinisphaera sp. Q1T1-3]|uniref:XrtA system polysaccharide chain length determinant n=1 Tax=Salinisphaera sp. Q1T1-3 TaxID=2321229 RepID=UPI000E71DFAF|nr:XrtA system polysaccharide chain length determinant [Salinisphaera sp. Q1T1-3]RJS94715.1 hypothetical protein D3260_02760 [Salinisphaera sp. Q1T1-3]
MQELFSLLITQLRNVWRFRWTALIIAWVIAPLAWLYVLSLPNQYQSSARVHIDTKSAISPLLSGMAVTPDPDEQVNLLVRTVMSRPNLRDIARSTGLDLKATTTEQQQALVNGLSQRIKLQNTGGGTDVYSISYTSANPKTAQSVVQEVISVMTTINLSKNTGDDNSAQAVDFLKQEVSKYRDQLTQTEQALASFKKEHAELMPGTDDYVARLQKLNADIDALQDKLAAARDQQASLEQQMGGASRSSGPARVSPSQSTQIRQLDDQIDRQQQTLTQLLSKYTPQHPDVIAAQRQLDQLKQRREDTLADLRANPGKIESPAGGSSGGSGSNSVAGQLSQVRMQVNTLQSSLSRKQDQLKTLQEGADNMNEAQAKLAELSRNYQVTRDQYEKLLSRLYSAQLSTDVQKSAGGLDFRVIDPPEVPVRPTGPKRILMMAVALIGALVAGVAFALFLAQIRPVFNSRSGLTQSTGYPVLGAVTRAHSPAERAKRRTALLIYAAFCMTLIVGFAAAVLLIPVATAVFPHILPSPQL